MFVLVAVDPLDDFGDSGFGMLVLVLSVVNTDPTPPQTPTMAGGQTAKGMCRIFSRTLDALKGPDMALRRLRECCPRRVAFFTAQGFASGFPHHLLIAAGSENRASASG